MTAIAPSPTAEATRLAEPERTSPAANTPAWLVSRRTGGARAPPVRPLTQLALGKTGGVVDAPPLELLAPVHAQPAVIDPRGDQEALRRDTLAAIDVHHRIDRFKCQAGHRGGNGQASTKLLD